MKNSFIYIAITALAFAATTANSETLVEREAQLSAVPVGAGLNSAAPRYYYPSSDQWCRQPLPTSKSFDKSPEAFSKWSVFPGYLPGGKAGTPLPLKWIHVEGNTDPKDPTFTQQHASLYDIKKMYGAALRFRGGLGSIEDVRVLMKAWMDTYDWKYQRLLADGETLDEATASIPNPIDEETFDKMVSAYAIARAGLTSYEVEDWGSKINKWGWRYSNHMDQNIAKAIHNDNSQFNNNWQSFRINNVTKAAIATNDLALFRKAREHFARHIENTFLTAQQAADRNVALMAKDRKTLVGVSRDFEARNAIHYHVFGLIPLVRAAVAADASQFNNGPSSLGYAWLDYKNSRKNNTSLRDAIDWVLPYSYPKDNPAYSSARLAYYDFVPAKSSFDQKRVNNKYPGYGVQYDPFESVPLMKLASILDSKYSQLVDDLISSSQTEYNNSTPKTLKSSWQELITEMRWIEICNN